MEKELKIIDEREVFNKDFRIYGTIENPLFLAKDIAGMIQYDTSKVGQMLNKIDEDEKQTSPIYYSGQIRNMYFLTEDGMYEVLMQSRKPIAKKFKKEVKKILKTIRKTGGYVNEGKEQEFIDNYFPTLSEETKKSMVKDLQKSVKELKPKADGYDRMINAKNNQTMNQVAKSLQVGRNKLFNFLRQKNILMKNNMPYQRFLEQGYFIVREFTKKINGEDKNLTQTLVTAKGIDYIHKKLKQVHFKID